jgi:hypothetical protein
MFQLHPLHHKPRLAPNFLCTSALVCSTAKEMENAEQHLTRWERAGLIDANTAAAIRGFEATRTKQGGRQWMVLLVLILGGILLGAGVLLFVAAHWAELSPLSRMFLVLAMLVFFHGMGLLVRGRFDALATAMHAVGTVSAGAAIALVGQIFNMQEHRPPYCCGQSALQQDGCYSATSFNKRSPCCSSPHGSSPNGRRVATPTPDYRSTSRACSRSSALSISQPFCIRANV